MTWRRQTFSLTALRADAARFALLCVMLLALPILHPAAEARAAQSGLAHIICTQFGTVPGNEAPIGAATAFAAPAAVSDMSKSHTGKPVMAGDLHLSGFWTRAMLPGQKAGGGFLIITNNGSADDRLVGVSTPHAARGEIHEMAVVDDVMKMRPLKDGLVIPAGETVELKPGGLHLMFMAVSEPFEEGGMVPVTVSFEQAGDVPVMLKVMPVGTKQMDHAGHGDHGKMRSN